MLVFSLLCVFVLGQNDPIATKDVLGIGSMQSAAVSGRLICNGRPAVDVKLKLYENEICKSLFNHFLQFFFYTYKCFLYCNSKKKSSCLES